MLHRKQSEAWLESVCSVSLFPTALVIVLLGVSGVLWFLLLLPSPLILPEFCVTGGPIRSWE